MPGDGVLPRPSCIHSDWCSRCFFTSRYGYKTCARIYLNGDGIGRGTHISVFFVVMRGEYDALLRWPFRQKVTFMLLDQNNVEHVIDSFRPDPNSSSFQRPRRETNIASGCPTFCPLSELNDHALCGSPVTSPSATRAIPTPPNRRESLLISAIKQTAICLSFRKPAYCFRYRPSRRMIVRFASPN